MMPPIITAVPLFWMMRRIGLTGSHLGLILIYVMSQLPFVIWMMKGFFDEVPKSIEESVLVDGGSRGTVMFRVLLPLAFPGIVATALFCIFPTWTEFLFASLFTTPPPPCLWSCPGSPGPGHPVGADERGDGGGPDPADDHHHGAGSR
jgi:multiple sugar transport system permease protein